MENNKYIDILLFLRQYGGNQYKKQEKCSSDEEKEYMVNGYQAGQLARASFTELVNTIADKYGLVLNRITPWQNSGVFVRYFWCQLKEDKYKDSQISVSVFAESTEEQLRFRVSVELATDKATTADVVAYKKLLDMPLDQELVYISGGNNETEFRVLDSKDNLFVKSLGLKKVQVSYIIPQNQIVNDEDLKTELLLASDKIIKYYSFIMSDDIKPIVGRYDSWEIISEVEAVKNCDKSFFVYNGSGVPKDICWFFGADALQPGEKKQLQFCYQGKRYIGTVRNESSDRLRTRVFWDGNLGKEFDVYKEQKVRARFLKSDIDEYEIIMEGDEIEMSVRESIDEIKRYIAAKGFSYADGMIENFYLSLKSKPFVILAGTSGTGKTKLVKLFAEAIGATAENGRYKLVPVRPDWSDSSDLFGHTDLNNRFHPGAILDFLKEAEANPTKTYFLCLDEMNLARVEYYLSDILSVIETREKTDYGRIVSVPLMSAENYGGDTDAEKKYGTIRFPDNLCLIGTVNMDETTFPFSKKVLDRANTIEFSEVDLVPDFDTFEVTASSINPGEFFLKPEYLQISHCKAHREYIQSVCESLEALNAILVKANAHVGSRGRDEICFYMLNNKISGLLTGETAMDYEIMQKILPRIQGSSNQIREMLCDLFRYCTGDYTGYDGNSEYDSMKTYLQNKGGKYRNSAEKIMDMVRRFDEDGFTSYWI